MLKMERTPPQSGGAKRIERAADITTWDEKRKGEELANILRGQAQEKVYSITFPGT
jgi:hypothetical protein